MHRLFNALTSANQTSDLMKINKISKGMLGGQW